MSGYQELLECGNLAIADMAMKCESVFSTHEHAFVSISGGADSDVMLDLCERVREVAPTKVTYGYLDTGMEYRATKRHLADLEDRYGVRIERVRPDRTVPVCVRDHGQPFVSKMVSHCMSGLQRNGFRWEDEPYAILAKRYPKAKSYVKWWSNQYMTRTGTTSSYCIARNKWLREFVIENPPWFRISAKCCTHSKKEPGDRMVTDRGADVKLIGVRNAEGGSARLPTPASTRATTSTCTAPCTGSPTRTGTTTRGSSA